MQSLARTPTLGLIGSACWAVAFGVREDSFWFMVRWRAGLLRLTGQHLCLVVIHADGVGFCSIRPGDRKDSCALGLIWKDGGLGQIERLSGWRPVSAETRSRYGVGTCRSLGVEQRER